MNKMNLLMFGGGVAAFLVTRSLFWAAAGVGAGHVTANALDGKPLFAPLLGPG